MATVGRLKDGDFLLAGEINERLPVVSNGLVAHFPFDGTGGAFDIVGGSQSMQNVQGGTNLVEALSADWKKPSSWASNAGMSWDDDKEALKIVGYHNTWLKTPIIIDPTKTYRLMFEVMIEVRPAGGLLYLGGLSNNAIGQRATTNYDYTIAAGNAPTLGVWTTFKLTRTGTAVAGSGNSYSYDTIKGWTGDTTNAAIPDRLIKNYHMGGLFNYSAGGTMYVRNMRMEVINADTSGVILFDEGVGVEDAATNLWSGPMSVYNNYSVPATFVQLKETYLGQPVWRLGMTVNDAAGSGVLSNFQTSLSSHGVVGGDRSWVQETPYVSSIYWRPVNKPDTIFGGVASNTAGWTEGETEKLPNGWNRYYRYRTGIGMTTVSDSIFHSFYCPSLQLNETIYIDVCCPQTEQGRLFPTAYTTSTRSSGRLDLPIPRLETYTIFGCFIPSSPLKSGSAVYNTAAGASLIRIEDSVKAGSFAYRYYLSGTASAPYVDQDGYYGASNIHQYYEIEAHKPMYFAIRKSGTQVRMKLHQNDWKAEHIFTVPADAGVDILKIGDSTRWNGKYSDISVYNRSLTDDEVNKLAKQSFKITSSGSLLVTEVKEEPNSLPSGVLYIPLSVDGQDKHKLIKPSGDMNTVYENGAVWVGSAVTNLYRQAISNADFPVKGSGVFTVNKIGREIEFKYEYNQNLTWTYHGQSMAVVSGTQYRASMDVFISKDANIASTGYTFIASMEGGCVVEIYYDNTKKGTWQHFDSVVTSTAATTNLYLYPSTDVIPATTGHIKYKNVMVTTLTFTPAFVEGTRPYSRLNYREAEVTTNSWEDFTLMMDIKYSQGGVYRLSGAWSRFYFGVQPNNTLMLSWIDGTQQSVGSGTVIPINQWTTIGVTVKNNVAIDLYVNGERVGGRGTGFSLSSTPMDFALNSFNNTDTSYPLNAWVKNLLFASRVLTAKEIKDMYSVQMRSYENKLQVRGQVIEGSSIG